MCLTFVPRAPIKGTLPISTQTAFMEAPNLFVHFPLPASESNSSLSSFGALGALSIATFGLSDIGVRAVDTVPDRCSTVRDST